MNDHFISVKLQFDTSKLDDDHIQKWYSDAHQIIQEYRPTSLPTYLFFSPSGNIVHRFSGALTDSDFLKLAKDALIPDKQYYTLLKNYQNGKKDFQKLPYLAEASRLNGENELANVIANDYIHNYLDKSDEDILNKKKNISFISEFYALLSSNDKYFQLFYSSDKSDDITGNKGFSKSIVDYVITKEEIDSKLWPNNKPIDQKPDWNKITAQIVGKYNKDYADRNVINAKIKWYDEKKNWPLDIKYNIQKIDKYGVDTTGWGMFFINNLVFNLIFQHSNDKLVLKKAINWMRIITQKNPEECTHLDTYANVLYKYGRVKEAISWEQKAFQIDEAAAFKENREPNPIYKETVERMKKGLPTWGQKYNM
jgi:thioredoxin-related protein